MPDSLTDSLAIPLIDSPEVCLADFLTELSHQIRSLDSPGQFSRWIRSPLLSLFLPLFLLPILLPTLSLFFSLFLSLILSPIVSPDSLAGFAHRFPRYFSD